MFHFLEAFSLIFYPFITLDIKLEDEGTIIPLGTALGHPEAI